MKNADDRNRTADLCFLRDHFTDSATTIALNYFVVLYH